MKCMRLITCLSIFLLFGASCAGNNTVMMPNILECLIYTDINEDAYEAFESNSEQQILVEEENGNGAFDFHDSEALLEDAVYLVNEDYGGGENKPDDEDEVTYFSATTAATRDYIILRGRKYSTELTDLAFWGLWGGITNEEMYYISYMVNLTGLQLAENGISDLTFLSGLTNLTRLWLRDNPISDLTPLSGLTNLTELILSRPQTNDRSPLISDLTPLANLTNLTRLELCDNEISDVTPLANLINLEVLTLQGNQISDVTPLAQLTNLRVLHLYDNPVEDWSPVEHLSVIGRP